MQRKSVTLWSSAAQFLTFFGLSMVLLLWLGIKHNLDIRHETARSAATRQLSTLSKIFEEHVTRALQEADKTLLLLRAAFERSPADFDLRAWVNGAHFKSDLAVQYALIGPDGMMIASNVGPQNSKVDLSDREHFRVHIDKASDELFISKPVLGRASGKWSIQLSRKLRDKSGQFAGVLVSSIDPYHFSRFYESVDLGKDGAVTLVGLDGIIRARGGMSKDILGQSIAKSEIFTAIQTSPADVMLGSGAVDGVRRLLGYRVVTSYPLIVIAAMSEREIYGNYARESSYYYSVGAVLTSLILIFVITGARSKCNLDRAMLELAAERDNAQHASQVKSSFLAVMSHEIRTPMNAVLGLTNALLEEPLTGSQRETVRTIQAAGDGLLSILNDILDYSKLEASKITLEAIPFGPPELIESAISIIGPRAAAKGLRIETSYDPALPPVLMGDAGRIRQVLLNLLSNAVKFTATGAITVRCWCTERNGTDATICWSVKDSGIGIATDKIDGLFNDFMQADSSINRRFGGSGLGLSICKRIVTAMGGTIGVESELGCGTTFHFTITMPVASQPNAITRHEPAHDEALRQYISRLGRPLRVLVADDNATNRLVAARMLREFDVHCSMAADGAEAVASVDRFPIDIVLMDVRMPEMDGLTATRVIRNRGITIPIVAFTANAFDEDVETCKAAGMVEFVAKPVRKPLLIAALMRALQAAAGTPVALKSPADQLEERIPAGTPLLDRSVFDQLAADLGPEAMEEAVAAFVEEMAGRIAALASRTPETDRDVINREAHTIKGTAATFGFSRVSELARWLEKNTATIDDGELAATAAQMSDAFAAARALLGGNPGKIAA